MLMKARLPWPVTVYLFCLVIPIWFDVGSMSLSSLRLFLLVMVVPLTIRLAAGKYGRLVVTDFLFLLHIGWATIALAVNNPSSVIGNVGSAGIEFLGGYVLARTQIRSVADFLALCRWMVFLSFCTLPLSLYEAKTGQPLLLELIRSLPGIDTFAKVRPGPRLGLFRAQTVFAHAVHHGLFCSVAFSLCFVALKGVMSGPKRALASAAIALSGFLALSSGALLAVVLQIALIAWAAIFARIRWRWWLLVALFALAYIVVDLLSNRDPISVFMSYATFSAHNAFWRGTIFEWGMKSVWAHPLYGVGLNDWVRPWFMYSGSMDNFWLVMAVRYGIPGFIFLALGYAIVIARVMRRNFDADPVLTLIRRAWVFTFLGLTFTLCTVHVWSSIYSFVFFMFGAGVWLIFADGRGPVAAPDTPDETRTAGPALMSHLGDRRRTAGMIALMPGRVGPQYSRYPAKIRRSPRHSE